MAAPWLAAGDWETTILAGLAAGWGLVSEGAGAACTAFFISLENADAEEMADVLTDFLQDASRVQNTNHIAVDDSLARIDRASSLGICSV